MAGPLAQALGSMEGYKGTSLTPKDPIKHVNAAQIEAPRGTNGLAESMRQFVGTAEQAYNQYDQYANKRAEERSNEIIRKLTPEQRREALGNGTLLYKDDARAMTLLRQKTGRNAAYEVDDEIQQKINRGEFRDRQSMQDYRQQRLSDRAISYAQQAGIDPEDSDYKRGFDTDIVGRNAGLHDLHSQFLSKNLEAQASIEARNDLTPLANDPKFLGSKDGAYIVTNYLNKGLETGEIPSDREATNTLTMWANDVTQKDGGADWLRNAKDHKINILGGEQTIENILGPEIYQNLILKADTATYTRNAKRTENLHLGIANAQAQADPSAGWQMLNKLEQENDWVQQGEQLTPQRSALIQAKASMIEAVKRQSAVGNVELEKRAQADNRQLLIDNAYGDRINQKTISVDPKFLPTDENTGKVTDADMANYAVAKMNQIDSMDIPQDQKDAQKLKYLKADYKDGPFQAAFGTLTQDASREWQAALISGDASNLPRLQELQRIYQQDPGTLAQLYPAEAGMMETLKFMGRNGLQPQILVDAQRNKPKNEDERRYREEQWSAIKNDSATADVLKYIPGDMEAMARSVFDAHSGLTGDSPSASKAVTEFLQENVVSFTEKQGTYGFRNTSFHGMLSKADLMTNPNRTESWEQGKAIVDDFITQLQKDSVWGASGMSVSSKNGTIIIQNMTGSRMMMNREQFQNLALDYEARAVQKKQSEAEADVLRTQRQYDTYFRGGQQNKRVE